MRITVRIEARMGLLLVGAGKARTVIPKASAIKPAQAPACSITAGEAREQRSVGNLSGPHRTGRSQQPPVA